MPSHPAWNMPTFLTVQSHLLRGRPLSFWEVVWGRAVPCCTMLPSTVLTYLTEILSFIHSFFLGTCITLEAINLSLLPVCTRVLSYNIYSMGSSANKRLRVHPPDLVVSPLRGRNRGTSGISWKLWRLRQGVGYTLLLVLIIMWMTEKWGNPIVVGQSIFLSFRKSSFSYLTCTTQAFFRLPWELMTSQTIFFRISGNATVCVCAVITFSTSGINRVLWLPILLPVTWTGKI